jgi:molybdenum cofactor cytidylyltransferase
MRAVVHQTLTDALGLGDRELVALVGGGGKSSALRVLAEERAAAGGRVVATTTTAMFLWQLTELGAVVVEAGDEALIAGLDHALAESPVAGAARAHGVGGKVVGLSTTEVDDLWAAGLADLLVIEADGSRGRSLKAFASHEPQVPAATTTIVLMAGLDAIGRPLDDDAVHRAGLLATAVGHPLGEPLTVAVVAEALRLQVRRLRHRGSERIVVLLNKADSAADVSLAATLAGELLDRSGRTAGGPTDDGDLPDAVAVATLRDRRSWALVAESPHARASTDADDDRGHAAGDAGPRVAAIVLAAGRATRMGVQKVLLPLHGKTLVGRAVDAAVRSKAYRTLVVIGHEADRVRQEIAAEPVTVVENPDHAAGMSGSLRAGVRAAGDDIDAALILLGDQPFVTSDLLDRLIDRFSATAAPAVRPVADGRPANPVLLGAALFPEIMAQRGDVGGREILERHAGQVSLVEIDDPRTVADIDTVQDYEAVGGHA